MKKPALIIICLIGLVVVLSIAKAVAYNKLSTSGVFVGKVEEEINNYKTQNAILSEKLLSLSSLSSIALEADKLGFAGDSSIIVIKTSRPLAIKQ